VRNERLLSSKKINPVVYPLAQQLCSHLAEDKCLWCSLLKMLKVEQTK